MPRFPSRLPRYAYGTENAATRESSRPALPSQPVQSAAASAPPMTASVTRGNPGISTYSPPASPPVAPAAQASSPQPFTPSPMERPAPPAMPSLPSQAYNAAPQGQMARPFTGDIPSSGERGTRPATMPSPPPPAQHYNPYQPPMPAQAFQPNYQRMGRPAGPVPLSWLLRAGLR